MSAQVPRPPASVPRPKPGGSVAPPAPRQAPVLSAPVVVGAKAHEPDPSRIAATVPPQPRAPSGQHPAVPAIPRAAAVPALSAGDLGLATVGESTGNESMSVFVANTGATASQGALTPGMPPLTPGMPPPIPAALLAGPSTKPAFVAKKPLPVPVPAAGRPAIPRAPAVPSTGSVGVAASTPAGSATTAGLGPTPGAASPPVANATADAASPAPATSKSAPPRPALGSQASLAPRPTVTAPPRPSASPRPSSAPRPSVAPRPSTAPRSSLAPTPTPGAGATVTPTPSVVAAPTQPRKPPYVSIRSERPAPEDLTPTLPREAIAYLEEHASKAAASAVAAMTPAPPEAATATATSASTDDDDPDSGWDTPDEPPIESAPIVPQVPVVLTSSSPALAAPPPAPTPSPRVAAVPSVIPAPSALGHAAFDEIEDLSARHVLSEVDDSLPTPAINGLAEGMIDPVPLARGPEASFTGSPLLHGPTPPPPMHTATTQPSSSTAAPFVPAAVDSPPAPPVTLDASHGSSPQLAALSIDDIPVVPAPYNPQKTQKIIRVPNAPRLVPEVMTPALLSAGPYRGEVHLEASGSGPALPAVPGLSASGPLLPGMVRDAQPTVLAQHRLQAPARAPIGEPDARPHVRKRVLIASALGSMAGVLLLGAFALGVGRTPPTPLVRTNGVVASRLMLTALRDVERAAPVAVEVAAAPTFHSSAATPEPAPEAPPTTVSKRGKHGGSAPTTAPPSAARRAPAKGSADGF